MDLLIFSSSFLYLGLIDSYISFRWVRRYSTGGEFELHCAFTTPKLDLLRRSNIICLKGDREAGVINTRRIRQDAEGNEVIIVTGSFVSGYLARRIIWGTEVLSCTGEIAMRTLVDKNCINPTDVNRQIPMLELGTLNNFIEPVNYQVGYSNLLDEINLLATVLDVGYRMVFDKVTLKLIFEIYKGLDRTAHQTINPRAIFSKEFDNVLESEYIDSLSNYANVVLISGAIDDPYYQQLLTIGTASNLDRFEIFTDQNSLSTQDENGYLSDVDYTNLLLGKGNEVLSEAKELKTFTSKINTIGNLKYKIDFDLGDVVTIVSRKWGVTLDSRITEIEEVYEGTGFRINVIFGNDVPTLLDKVKNMTKQPVSGGSNIPLLTHVDGGTFI